MLSKSLNIILIIALLGYGIYYIYKMPKYSSGEVAPNFTVSLADGSSFSLSDLKGKYILLDFWGSWCGPCRAESPELVSLYDSWASGGNFEIVSIAIESNKQSWLNAVEQDQLRWKYHIMEAGRFKSPIAQLYSVREIPTKYLLDKDGIVVATNPSFGTIDKLLADNLGQ